MNYKVITSHNGTSEEIAQTIHLAWNEFWSKDDVEGLLTLYADNAVIESPLIPYLLGEDSGFCQEK